MHARVSDPKAGNKKEVSMFIALPAHPYALNARAVNDYAHVGMLTWREESAIMIYPP